VVSAILNACPPWSTLIRSDIVFRAVIFVSARSFTVCDKALTVVSLLPLGSTVLAGELKYLYKPNPKAINPTGINNKAPKRIK
jgi:hypothetical protein